MDGLSILFCAPVLMNPMTRITLSNFSGKRWILIEGIGMTSWVVCVCFMVWIIETLSGSEWSSVRTKVVCSS